MSHIEYLVILAAGCAALFWADRRYAGIWKRGRRLAAVTVLNLALFLAWDSLGVHRGYWRTLDRRVIGVWPLPGVPLEELLLLSMVTYASLVLWRVAAIASERMATRSKSR